MRARVKKNDILIRAHELFVPHLDPTGLLAPSYFLTHWAPEIFQVCQIEVYHREKIAWQACAKALLSSRAVNRGM